MRALASAVPEMEAEVSLALMMSSPAMASISGSEGAWVSSTKARTALASPRLPATSVTTALRLLGPSAPSSVPRTVKSTRPARMSPFPSVATFGVWKDSPPISSSTLSPATASEPFVGKLTRKVVLCASAPLIHPSPRSLLSCSASCGAEGATVSTWIGFVASGDTLPALSVALAVSVSGPCPMFATSASVSV